MKTLTLLFLFPFIALAQENVIVSGKVTDATTKERLAAANIRVRDTSLGTVANADGVYRLILPPGKRILIVSSIGYTPDTLHLILTNDETRNVALTPSDIILPEVVVSSEDPAIEIIRRAIANKQKWMERLTSYELDAFTRQVLKRDTSIASITESFTKGYWQKGDTLREIVKQKRQTENVKSEFNFASVGRILNFNENEVRFVGYTFIGPTADDALNYYDYKLLRTQASFGKEIFEIKMIPRTRMRPLFEGTINIAGDSYALMGVDVVPNEAFSIPFVKEKSLRYRQQFGLYENSYWMPADIRIDVTARIGAMGIIKLPPIGFTQTSVISSYDINTAIPDSIFKKPRLTIDSIATASLDTAKWNANIVLPLTREETEAYKTLDSTKSLDVQFRPRGFAINVGVGDSGSVSAIQYLDVYFNRVEGLHLGLKNEFDEFSDIAKANAGFSYGFSDKRWKYILGATVFTSSKKELGIGAEFYRRNDHRTDAGYYGVAYNSLTSLIAKNDYRDYFEAEGWKPFVAFNPTEKASFALSFASETHRSVQQNSDFGIFSGARLYRVNQPINNGRLRSLQLDVRIGDEPVPFELVRQNGVELHAEHSGDITGGDFAFNRVWGTGTLTLPTFSRSLLFPQSLTMRLSAGTAGGDAPTQRLFDLESSSSSFAPFGVMRTLRVKEFSGTSFVALNLEHNFRSVPFLALGIPFLYENNIEFIIHGGIAKTWDSNLTLMLTSNPPVVAFSHQPLNTTNGLYGELGFGFSRIFDLLRADFTWRLSKPNNFRFTLGVANLF